jgi:hypothetical protein
MRLGWPPASLRLRKGTINLYQKKKGIARPRTRKLEGGHAIVVIVATIYDEQIRAVMKLEEVEQI